MKNFYNNGYIIQREGQLNYRGIDGDNWYLNYCSDSQYFQLFFDENIDTCGDDLHRVACCTDEEYIRRYMEESKKCKIPFRILQCSTNREKPVLEENCIKGREKILGYDIAYSGGSYYSCILNDIVSGRIEEFSMIQLNNNGLFETYEEAEAFFKYRTELEKNDKDYLYEKGDYVIYRIAEIIL